MIYNKKCLIVCYSYSGNTWRIAEEICKQTNGTLCEIYPKQPYPMMFQSLLKQVRKEIDTSFKPPLFQMWERVEHYDVIFTGTPVWCGTMAPPLAAFLQENSTDGKIILPFYSHCGGGKGNVEHDIRNLCSGAEVRQGISVVNDGGSSLSDMISEWIKSQI